MPLVFVIFLARCPVDDPYDDINLLTYKGTTELTITGYKGRGSVTIPAEINGIPVTAIGEFAFAVKNITSVTLPNTITSIGQYAFYESALTSIIIPDGVKIIRNNSFSNNKLENVIIPYGVTSINNLAFNNNKLTSIIIPDSVERIGHDAFTNNIFSNITLLTSITIGAGVEIFIDDELWENIKSFGSGFDEFYNENNKAAGIYTRPNTNSTVWSFQDKNE